MKAKACMACERVTIGHNFERSSPWRVFAGLPFVYLPIVFLPFFLLSGLMIQVHLRFMGAQNLRGLRSFMPDWKSHRYSFKTQIVRRDAPRGALWVRSRLFWIFNCTFYCPFSVAVLEWHTYLVKLVENWWCPFHHANKENYAISSIDKSYWHAVGDDRLLHEDDRANPIWKEPGDPALSIPEKVARED